MIFTLTSIASMLIRERVEAWSVSQRSSGRRRSLGKRRGRRRSWGRQATTEKSQVGTWVGWHAPTMSRRAYWHDHDKAIVMVVTIIWPPFALYVHGHNHDLYNQHNSLDIFKNFYKPRAETGEGANDGLLLWRILKVLQSLQILRCRGDNTPPHLASKRGKKGFLSWQFMGHNDNSCKIVTVWTSFGLKSSGIFYMLLFLQGPPVGVEYEAPTPLETTRQL